MEGGREGGREGGMEGGMEGGGNLKEDVRTAESVSVS